MLGNPRNVSSVHLTLLRRDGSGKAELETPKLTIGSPTIKVGDEMRGLPIVLAPPNDLLGLAITEGIEDALSVYVATGLGAWAAGSASFMPKLADTVPDYIEAVTIWAHPDPAGQKGARQLAQALLDRGIEVSVEGLLARSLTDREIVALVRN
jgi:putative DNA primase/helicase